MEFPLFCKLSLSPPLRDDPDRNLKITENVPKEGPEVNKYEKFHKAETIRSLSKIRGTDSAIFLWDSHYFVSPPPFPPLGTPLGRNSKIEENVPEESPELNKYAKFHKDRTTGSLSKIGGTEI